MRVTPDPSTLIAGMQESRKDLAGRFATLVQAHRGILYKIAQIYCPAREDRADLIQDILLELWRSFPRYDGRAAFSTWMHRVGVNVAISFFRGESRRIRGALPIESMAMDLRGADDVMDAAAEDFAALNQLVLTLDGIDRALVLLFLEGYAHEETADMLGLGTSNVSTRLQRIKQRLQRTYQTRARP